VLDHDAASNNKISGGKRVEHLSKKISERWSHIERADQRYDPFVINGMIKMR